MCNENVSMHAVDRPHNVTEVSIPLQDGAFLPATFVPSQAGRGPVVLLLTDLFGRSAFYEGLAFRLAAEGFHVLTPDLFFRVGMLAERTTEAGVARRRTLNDVELLRDLDTAIEWALHQPGIDGEKVGTAGFCLGGTLALNLASRRPDLATVSYYGFPGRPRQHHVNAAAPPIEEVSAVDGPILALWGGEDHNVGMDNVAAYSEALAASGVEATVVVHPGLGHNFLGDALDDPSNANFALALSSWEQTIAFYRLHLGPKPRLIVDLDKCNGYASCVALAPDVFEFGDDMMAHVRMANPSAEFLDLVREAVTECPMRAIHFHP